MRRALVRGRPASYSQEYTSWHQMLRRCTDPEYLSFRNYGGRGISVCASWVGSFDAFIRDVGLRPTPKHQLDRIDNNDNYEPGNCRWATKREQARNRRTNRFLTFNGETLTVVAWAERIGLSKDTLRSRLNSGWSLPDALTVPRISRYQHREKFLELVALDKKAGMSAAHSAGRLGLSIDQVYKLRSAAKAAKREVTP